MAIINKAGNYFVTDKIAFDITDNLAPANYIINQNPMTGEFFLNKVDSFVLPEKIYGDINMRTERVLRTFNQRQSSTGVLLNGEKGSGKTLLAKNISIQAALLGMPTILVNRPFSGDVFNTFMSNLDQPCVILFDEFEKVYTENAEDNGNAAANILTLFDGTVTTKKLFVLTCNDKFKLNSNLLNRPNRIFYKFEYAGLSSEVIKAFLDLNLKNKNNIPAFVKIADLTTKLNFDMLNSIVEEMNRSDETCEEVLQYMNVDLVEKRTSNYDYVFFINNKEIKRSCDWIDPFNDKFHVCYSESTSDPRSVGAMESDASDSADDFAFIFVPGDIVEYDSKKGLIVYETTEDGVNYKCKLQETIITKFNINNIF